MSIQLNAQKRVMKKLLIYSDTTLIKSVENYEEFTFTDTGNHLISGKIFIKNDSQFLFVNYFNEPNSRTYNFNEIKGVDALVYPESSNKVLESKSGNGQKYFISPGTAVAIVFLSGPFGLTYLIVREIILVSKYGIGHSKFQQEVNNERSRNRTKVLKHFTKLNFKVVKA